MADESQRSSTTNLGTDNALTSQELLAKIESQTAPGEFSPVNGSQAPSIKDEKTLEEGGEPEQGQITHRPTGIKWALIMISLLIGLFLFSLDNTIVADIQPAVVNDFQAVEKISWLATSFLLAATAFVLPFGQMQMLFPTKWFYIASVVVFEVGSAVCGAAPSMTALIVGRAIAGLGAVGIYNGVLCLISVNTSEAERPAYIGMTGLTWGLGTVLGPVIGGAFADSSATWRWAFYINLPVGGITVPIILFLIPAFDAMKGARVMERIKRVDWVSLVLIAGSISSLVLAFQFGGNQYPWNSGQVIGCFVTFGVLLVLFALNQMPTLPWQSKEKRMFPVAMLFNRVTFILAVETATASGTAFLAIYYIPIYFQFTRGDSAIGSAVRLLPIIFTLVFGCVAGGIALSKVGYYSPFYIFGSILALIGACMFYTADLDTNAGYIYGASIFVGLGTGLYMQASFAIATVKVPPEMLGQATGFMALSQTLGPTIALAIAGTVFINTATSGLVELLPNAPLSEVRMAIAGTSGQLLSSLDEATRRQALGAITDSVSRVYILSIAATALGVASSVFLPFEKIIMAPGAGGGA